MGANYPRGVERLVQVANPDTADVNRGAAMLYPVADARGVQIAISPRGG
jgi:hypothetical protein